MTDNNVSTDETTRLDPSPDDDERVESSGTAADPKLRDYRPDDESSGDRSDETAPDDATHEERVADPEVPQVPESPGEPQWEEVPTETATEVEAGEPPVADATLATPTGAAEVSSETEGPEAGEEEEEEEEPDYFFAPGDWYVVHTYAGYENKVKANLASRIQSMNMEDKIYDVVVPTEEVMELKSGKMQSVQKKVFPGYILVRMELDDDSWYVVRNTPGVTGFVGSGAKPTPLEATEVTKILAPKTEDRPKPKLDFEVGEVVNVVGGAFAGYSGPVDSIDVEKQTVRVLLDLFGRETPVELTFQQVTKL